MHFYSVTLLERHPPPPPPPLLPTKEKRKKKNIEIVGVLLAAYMQLEGITCQIHLFLCYFHILRGIYINVGLGIALASIWFRMVLTQIIAQVCRDVLT
jgi:hypothetical protein